MKKNIAELLDALLQENTFKISPHLLENQVTDEQNRKVNIIFKTLRGNLFKGLVPTAWGGYVNDEAINSYSELLKSKIAANTIYQEYANKLNGLVDQYIGLLSQQIVASCALQLPVEKLPFSDLYILVQPRIKIPKNKPERMELKQEGFTIAGELQGVVSKNVVYTHFPDGDPQFAPINGKLEIPYYEMPPQLTSTFNQPDFHFRFVDLIDHPILTNYGVQYRAQGQKAQQPYCNFLNSDSNITEALDQLRTPSHFEESEKIITVLALIQRLKTSSTIIVYNAAPVVYETILNATAALCHLGAGSYEFPGTRIIRKLTRDALHDNLEINVPVAELQSKEDADIPDATKLQYWSQRQLNAMAQKRGIVNLPTWSEEELEEMAIQRGIVKLPVWTEKELDELANERGLPPLDLPEWDPNPNLLTCSNCGYALQPDWDECPICNQPIVHSDEQSESQESDNESSNKNGDQDDASEINEETWQPPSD